MCKVLQTQTGKSQSFWGGEEYDYMAKALFCLPILVRPPVTDVDRCRPDLQALARQTSVLNAAIAGAVSFQFPAVTFRLHSETQVRLAAARVVPWRYVTDA